MQEQVHYLRRVREVKRHEVAYKRAVRFGAGRWACSCISCILVSSLTQQHSQVISFGHLALLPGILTFPSQCSANLKNALSELISRAISSVKRYLSLSDHGIYYLPNDSGSVKAEYRTWSFPSWRRAGKMSQWLWRLAALLEDPSLVSRNMLKLSGTPALGNLFLLASIGTCTHMRTLT